MSWLFLTLAFDLMSQAQAAREAGRAAEAIGLYQQVVAQAPQLSEAWWYLGTLQFEARQFVGARNAFQQVARLEPTRGPAWAFLGLAEFETGLYPAALRDLLHARATGLTGDEQLAKSALYHQALAANKLGQFELAVRALTAFASANEDSPAILEASGLSALRLAKLPADLTDDEYEVAIQAGRVAFDGMARRRTAAIAGARDLAERYPRQPNVRYLLGNLLMGEDSPAAIAAFQAELKLSPRHVPARLQIAIEQLSAGKARECATAAAEAARIEPANFAARGLHGRCLTVLGELPAAIAELERAVQLAPDSPETHFHLAAAYSRAGLAAKAAAERAVFQRLSDQRGRSGN
ncbi:MAG: tetratricopeptide repeat protein [Bryobacteraceae bacterium]|nr:tetratricopeptide repeat protein [Bryobacteraceae bacterium]